MKPNYKANLNLDDKWKLHVVLINKLKHVTKMP